MKKICRGNSTDFLMGITINRDLCTTRGTSKKAAKSPTQR